MKLGYLDGLRGLAAVTVVVSHCLEQTGAHPFLSSFLGRIAVGTFIVLSGYCLSLPVVRSDGKTLEGGLAGFARRRALRMLPPYYGALILSMLLVLAIPRFGSIKGIPVVHLLLLHNWYPPMEPRWEYAIDPPLWTVATEWQIYFVFALVLIPIWRRFGAIRAAVTAIAGGILFQSALMFVQPETAVNGPCPWFLGLFGMGMGVASVESRSLAKRIPWIIVLCCSIVATTILWRTHPSLKISEIILGDGLIGVAAASFLVWARLQERNGPPILRFLSSQGMRALGGFSYSLYVTHILVLWTICYWVVLSGTAKPYLLPILLTLGVSTALAFAFVFHLVFERPFSARRDAAKEAASREPAAAERQ